MRHKRHTQDLIVRRLHAIDQKDICDHFLRLDAPSRRSRFCSTVNDDGVIKYAKNIFAADSIICGAFVDGQLRGLVELRGTFLVWRSTTEAAFSVEADWQNMGIGDALFDRISAIAQNRGIKTIHMMCLKENSRMKHLAVKHHARLHQNQDAVEAMLYPHWPTLVSLAKEVLGETKGYLHIMFGRCDKVPQAKGPQLAYNIAPLTKN